MKEIRNKNSGIRTHITVLCMLVVFSLFNCKKDSKDNTNLLLAALALSGPNGTATFNLSSNNSLLNGRNIDSSQNLSLSNLPSQSVGFLTNLSGEDPANYGDGGADGFADKFLTPEAVGIEVCQIVAYKSAAKGGPARGSETLENSNFLVFTPAMAAGLFGFLIPTNAGPCSAFLPAGLTNKENVSSFGLSIKQIPENEKEDYDRIGIVARAFTYYFKAEDLPENAYRYVDLILNNAQIEGLTPPGEARGIYWGQADRGDVVTKVFTKECYSSYLNSASFIFHQLLSREERSSPRYGCAFMENFVDAGSGSFINGLGTNVHFTNPNDFLNPAANSGTLTTDKSKKLKFKLPAAVSSLEKRDPFILVVDLDTKKGVGGNLLFNVSVENTLFWDSTGADNVFSPQNDLADRPNATSGSDNLTNTTRRNLIFHLPTILSETK